MVRCRFCVNLTAHHVCTHYKVTIKADNIDKSLPCNFYAPNPYPSQMAHENQDPQDPIARYLQKTEGARSDV